MDKETKKYSYITYLLNDLFVPGVITLFHSLKKHSTKYDLYCMITPEGVSKENFTKMEKEGIKLIHLNKSEIIKSTRDDFEDRYKDENWKMFTKLNIFNQVQFDKLIYLDSDIIILDNIDELFNYPSPAAYYDDEALNVKNYGLSAGVMVICPNALTFQDMLKHIDNPGYGKTTDQSFLNYYFSDFYRFDKKYNRLYKVLRRKHKISEIKNKNKIKVLHFNGQKPWLSAEQKMGWKLKKDKAYKLYHQYEFLWNKKELEAKISIEKTIRKIKTELEKIFRKKT